MRTRVWCMSLVLAALGVACGDQTTEVSVEEETVQAAGMAQAPGATADATASSDDGLTISTDKDDYQPGDTLHLSGANWPASDVLDVVLTDAPQTHEPHEWTVTVAEDGTFQDSTYVVDQGDLDVTFTLVATSRTTQRSLSVMFTDANINNNVSMDPNPVFVARGGSATTTVTITFGGNNDDCTADLTVTGLPTGASGSLDPTSVTGNGSTGNTTRTSVLTITTLASTALGPDPYTVTATAASAGCDGAASRSGSGTVTVFGPANKLAIGQQPANTVANATISPAVTVFVQDASGNLVANSSAPVTLAISTNPGGGTLSGTVTKNAVNGVATFNDLAIDKIGNGYRLTATSSGLTQVTSSTFNIVFGPPNSLVFSTQPSGGAPSTPFATQPAVQVRDAIGNLITSGTGSTANITLSIVTGTGAGGAVLTCTPSNTRAAVAGVATFAGCRINLSGTDYRLRATFGSLTADSDPFNITAVNQPPNVNAGGPYTVAEGTALTLTPTVTDPDDDPLTYQWSIITTGIDAGGSCSFDNPAAKNAKVTCTDDSQAGTGGKFTLALQVDDGTALVTDNADLTVTNADPTADAGDPYSGSEGADIQLNGSGDDPGNNDDTHLGYQWTVVTTGIDAGGSCDFDNASSKNAKVNCTDDGSFKVRLVVSDDDGGTSVASEATLTVDNAGPVAEAGGPYHGDEGSPVQLHGTVTDAGANDTHVWLWKYTDGAGIDGGICSFDNENEQDPKITCTDDGTVELTLKVTDDDGAASEDTAILTLANVNPEANAGGSYTGNEGSPVQLNGSVTDAGTNDSHTWAWQYVGTNVDPGATCHISNVSDEDPTITCTDDGTIKLTLTVTDDDGGSDSDDATLTLYNVNPVATAGGPYSGNEGTEIQLTGMKSDAGSNDVLTQQWTYAPVSGVDAGATCSFSPNAAALSPKVTCTDDGVYQLTLTINDDDGGTGSSNASLTVANVNPLMTALTAPDGSSLPETIIVAGTLGIRTTFGDKGSNDSHTAELDCGTGYVSLGSVSAASPITPSCNFATIGPKTVKVKVTDDDGGYDVQTHSILVKYDFDGFYAPVDRPNTMNVSKAGQAIPLKWTLRNANGTPVTDVATVTVKTVAMSCDQATTTDPLEEYASSTSGLINFGDGRYQYNWKTATTLAGTCKSMALVFAAGGVSYIEGPHAFFSFKK